jgi:hypothetical protein
MVIFQKRHISFPSRTPIRLAPFSPLGKVSVFSQELTASQADTKRYRAERRFYCARIDSTAAGAVDIKVSCSLSWLPSFTDTDSPLLWNGFINSGSM